MTNTAIHPRGYTLIEAVVMVGVFFILSIMIVQSILYLYRVHSGSINQATSLASANKGLNQMVREIRGATYAEDGAYPLVAFGTSSLTLYSDVDQDYKVERVRYYLNGTNLQRGIIEPTSSSSYPLASEVISTLVRDVRDGVNNVMLFQYYDANNATTTDLSSILGIRRIAIELVVNSDPTRQPTDIVLKSSASPRNISITQ